MSTSADTELWGPQASRSREDPPRVLSDVDSETCPVDCHLALGRRVRLPRNTDAMLSRQTPVQLLGQGLWAPGRLLPDRHTLLLRGTCPQDSNIAWAGHHPRALSPIAERHLRVRDLHVVPAPGQVLLQALQGGQAQLPLQLSTVPLLGGQDLTQGDNFLFYLQKHAADVSSWLPHTYCSELARS